MSEPRTDQNPLKMVECGRCRAKVFISANLAPMETSACSKCGHPVMLATQMRQFELRSIIASGGMGTVFRAFDVNLQREVALKMMKREMAQDADVMSAFYREARASASLNHTNIIHIYTFDEFDGQPYIAMELADHGSLDSWIERDGRVPELYVLDVAIKVASALDTALKHNLLHRDIKPANILFNSDGEPKLVDFGLAGASDSQMPDDGTIWGTPDYVAPEKIERKGESFLSDMYSLGGTLYHALTGQPPFRADTVDDLVLAHVNSELTPPILAAPHVSQDTSDAIALALAKNPEERFRSYDEFIMAFTASRSKLLVSQIRQAAEDADAVAAISAPRARGWWRK
jgi:serine/threonine protein kinase